MRRIRMYIIIGFVFVAILGTLAHFFYEWSGNNQIIGLFHPVNESTWEHMKLVCFPMLAYMLILAIWHGIHCYRNSAFSYEFHKKYPCFWGCLFQGIIYGCIFIPVAFYTYSGILGWNTLVIDIIIYYLAIFIAFLTTYFCSLRQRSIFCCIIPALLVAVLVAAFICFTYNPPSINLFQSP